MRRAGQRANARPHPAPTQVHEYQFLVGRLIDRATLQRAEVAAAECGAAVHEVLLATGWIAGDDYTSALANAMRLPQASGHAEIDASDAEAVGLADTAGLPARLGRTECRVLSATCGPPRLLQQRVSELHARGIGVALASPSRMAAAIDAQAQADRLDRAIRKLQREQPNRSAGCPTWSWQIVTGAMAAGVVLGGFCVLPEATMAALSGLVALPFLCVTALRLVALREVIAGGASRIVEARPTSGRLSDHLLPSYSVLVPLFREANVLPGLVQSLRALDYPPAKLEILLILEEVDTVTQAALLQLELPGNFRTVVVPDEAPRTKPKALNYALQIARGEYVVVYDAEDRPQPDQLRRAVERFRGAPPALGCLQGQLNIYNPWDSWFTRQFTIEYSALFDAILPALERLRLPVPLGGTSNHFPRATLIDVGAWDPFNVTEDADLGMRLVRGGLYTAVLPSTTWEEAPATLRVWVKQRTRWLKGWMQTYLVHTRQLWQLNAELGLRGAIGFHTLMGGLIVSALVHPLFYLLLAYFAFSGHLFEPAETTLGAILLAVAWINLAIGYAVSILVGMFSVCRRGRPGLALGSLLMPLYWLLISFAAYRAAYQLVRAPYLWEKTEHGKTRHGKTR
jgi:glycosyltransferase XagB